MKLASVDKPTYHDPVSTSTYSAAMRGLVVLIGGAALWMSGCDSGAPESGARPNVLLYISDTLRADGLGCYGNPDVETPALDRFAKEGVLFERALAPSSWTRASIGSILTGTAPAVHGAEARYDLLADSAVLISELFGAAGYRVGSITTNRNVGSFFGFDQGFAPGDFIELYENSADERVSVEELTTLADDVTTRAIEWLSASDEPFCLVVHAIDPHSPYMPPERWDRFGEGIASSVDGSQKSLHQLKTARSAADEARVVSLYYGEIAFNDHAFGELIDWLRERGIYDQTVVAFTSDHGEEFWEHGERGHGKTLNDKALHVPLILRYPMELERGSRERELVSTVDLLPTLLDLAELESPAFVEGRSLARSTSEPELTVYSSCKLGGLELQSVELQSAKRGDWKLVFDVKSGKKKLFRLSGEGASERDVLSQNRELGRELYKTLAAELKRQSGRRVELYGSLEPLRVDSLTEEVRSDLEHLGYIGEGSEDEENPSPKDPK